MARILVADDDQTCRDSIQTTLQREGHLVEGAPDVDSALAAIDEHPFDLVVCDYRMPGKTGLDLLIELRRRHSDVPVLMISGYADAETKAAAREWGALELLQKPVRRRQLIETAAQFVRSHPC